MDKKNTHGYDFLNRTIPILTEEGIYKLRNSTIAIAGCGGVGGAAAITLARLGVGRFILADPGRFDKPDVNRQWAAFKSTLGRNKAEVYEKTLKDINPAVVIKKFNDGVPFETLSLFLDEVDIVIDSLDYAVDYESRKELYRQTRKKEIFILTCPILGFGVALMSFSPSGMTHQDFMELWNKNALLHIKRLLVPECIDLIQNRINKGMHEIPSLSLSVVLAASLLVTESLIILLPDALPIKRKPISAPKFLIVDLLKQNYNILDATKL